MTGGRCKQCAQPSPIFGDDHLCGRCWDAAQDQADHEFRRRALGLSVFVGLIIGLISVIVYFLVEHYG